MKDNTWFVDLENYILTRVEADCLSSLKATYPNIKFTTSSINQMTNFPTVYIHQETGNTNTDMQGNVNGIDSCRFTIEVYSDKSQTVARKVMKKVLDSLIGMGFSPQIPSFNNMSTVYRQTCIVKRAIGSEDTF